MKKLFKGCMWFSFVLFALCALVSFGIKVDFDATRHDLSLYQLGVFLLMLFISLGFLVETGVFGIRQKLKITSIKKHLVFWGLLLVIAGTLFTICYCNTSEKFRTNSATSQPSYAFKPTNTPKPTKAPIPTNTPKPTSTPKPTNTPKPTKTPTATPRPTNTPMPTPTPDLSAFEGDCEIDVMVDIEKPADVSQIYIDILATNTSSKNISKFTIYFVQCYDDDSPIESTGYGMFVTWTTELMVGESVCGNHRLNAASAGAREYKAYIAYILFEDGSEWGNSQFNHLPVVTRGVEADVWTYGSGVEASTDLIEKNYIIEYSAQIVQNNSVGDSWYYGMYDGDTYLKPGATISASLPESRSPKLIIYAEEDDAANDDSNEKEVYLPSLDIGETKTFTEQIVVTENDGRYRGNSAVLKFTITVTRITDSDVTTE